MSSPWTAAQLDRIEDALEHLERDGVPGELASGPDAEAVAQPLAAYREILALSREAMPLQDVPAGLLDGVLAEAHATAAESPAPVVAAVPEASPGWWQRVRATIWVPALGFAGAAAALILFLRPAGDEEAAATVAQRSDPAPAADPVEGEASPADARAPDTATRLADAEDAPRSEDPLARNFEADRAQGMRRSGGLIGAALGDAEPTDARAERPGADLPSDASAAKPEEPVPDAKPTMPPKAEPAKPSKAPIKVPNTAPNPAPSAGPSGGTSKTSSKSSGKSGKADQKKRKSNAGGKEVGDDWADDDRTADKGAGAEPGAVPDAPTPAPAPPPPPEEDGKLAKLLERGEQRRRSGNCGLARLDFQRARKAADPRTAARALAGLGLCELAAGNDAAAKSYFGQAKARHAAVAAFIERERAKLEAAPQQTKKK